jgi:ribose 5-phosphate isomerase B
MPELKTSIPLQIGLAADHGGFALKEQVHAFLSEQGHVILDFGAPTFNPADDYPDFVIPLAEAVANGRVTHGIAICSSGVGACIAANKIVGVKACLMHDYYSAHQGVEHDALNLLCLGGSVLGNALALDLISAFLQAKFTGQEGHQRRLEKIAALERRSLPHEKQSAYHA